MRFRLYPTPAQEVMLRAHCTHARFVWNLGLEQRNMYRPRFGPTPGHVEMNRQLTEARACSWLAGGSQTVQQQALRDLDRAFQNWWTGTHGRPTWRKRGVNEGFRIVGGQAHRWERLSRKRARVLIPKVGWVDWRWTRDPGDPKSYRVTLDRAGRWWISFAVIPEPIEGPGNGSVIGIDRGVAQSFAMSTGEMVKVPGLTETEKACQLRLKRKLARQVKGSKRREQTKRSINRIEHRRVNRTKDCVEKLTTRLATDFDRISIEDLKIKNMIRSAAGTVENPGTNVAQKRGLNRSIQAQGWGLFACRLEDKAPGRVTKVNPANTSRRCSQCGYTCKENRESQAIFRCGSCGHTANADVNAATNIAAGHAVTTRGGSKSEPVKREPQLVLTG